ncbi:hypothetical protein GGS21DRAFT_500863 [Xylaria nigripes]|nr:hypothetical protein GGS21DRAFT_500863 [Xylaria nigripes]
MGGTSRRVCVSVRASVVFFFWRTHSWPDSQLIPSDLIAEPACRIFVEPGFDDGISGRVWSRAVSREVAYGCVAVSVAG